MIIDIVLIITVVLALVIGLYKGFAGVLLGFLGTIMISLALIVGIYFLAPNIMYKDASVGISAVVDEETNVKSPEGYNDLFMMLYTPISESMASLDENFYGGELVMVDDMLQVKVPYENGDYTTIKFSVVVTETFSFFGSKSDNTENEEQSNQSTSESSDIPFLDNFITKYGCEGLTISNALASLVTLIIMCAIIHFVAFVVLVIIKWIIRRLLFKTLDAHSVASKVDRAIGAVFTVAMVICIAWVAISLACTLVGSFGVEENFLEKMEANPICGFFSQHPMFGGIVQNPDIPADNSTDEVIKAVVDIATESIV